MIVKVVGVLGGDFVFMFVGKGCVMMCAEGVHVPEHFDRKQSENTKDGSFYEAKRRSKAWIIL